MRAPRALLAAAMLALVAGGLSACTPAAPVARVAPVEHRVVLGIATADDSSGTAAKQILRLADEVHRLSHGSVTVQPHWDDAHDPPDYDQANARFVISGRLALGLIPSRAWDRLGVRTLRALNTPFLVTTDEQVRTIVSGPVKQRLLAGLTGTPVVGLDLFPEGLRHPFGFGKPLLGVADYRGALITAPLSGTVTAMFKAFGATPRSTLAATDRGAESSYRLTDAQLATGNVAFYPKVNVLVANRAALARLSPKQRAALRAAATRTRAWALATQPSDSAAAADFCTNGGSVVLASAKQVESLRTAVKPLVHELERDAATGPVIAAIRAAAPPPTTPPAVKPCG